MTYTNEAIVQRFFQALDDLKATKRIRGVQTFTRAHNINRRNLHQLRLNPSRKIFDVSWLAILVVEYGIDATWLLTGQAPLQAKTANKRQEKIAPLQIAHNQNDTKVRAQLESV